MLACMQKSPVTFLHAEKEFSVLSSQDLGKGLWLAADTVGIVQLDSDWLCGTALPEETRNDDDDDDDVGDDDNDDLKCTVLDMGTL